MKKIIMTGLLFILFLSLSGVGFVINGSDDDNYVFASLKRSGYQVNIENQVAQVKCQEVFKNETGTIFVPRFYFPIPPDGNATKIRWFAMNHWYEADISPNAQNPPGGPSTTPQYIVNYFNGYFPLVFDATTTLPPNDSLLIEIEYVRLLPYSNGNVDLVLKNDYSLISGNSLLTQTLDITLNSNRTITSFDLLGINNEQSTVGSHTATSHYSQTNTPADADYHLVYSMSQEEMGLWTMSNYFDAVADSAARGFFTMIVEPDPSESTNIIDKVFTLILDRSGSMSGDKIVQARNAATYIVNNLNEGDMFNIISFATDVTPLWNSHQAFNTTNKQTALNFISAMQANGSTNISGAFGTAVPQFNTASTNTANIIIFMTDGEQTAGITDTQELINYINNLIDQTETNINLFNFGIGTFVNQPLLSTTANENSGMAVYLGNNELYSVLTDFYNIIRNPVLLNPTLTVSPSNVILDIHPADLPNLYLGKQMIISGRYEEPTTVNLTFSGTAYNQPVTYQYAVVLSETNNSGYSFLTKIWAKQKIDDLMALYFSYPNGSAQAEEIRNQIIDLSMLWGVLSPFTSFVGGDIGNEDEPAQDSPQVSAIKILGNYPNPFNPSTKIRFAINKNIHDKAMIKIYNLKGQLIKTLFVTINGKGNYSVEWNGKNEEGLSVSSGIYMYKISCGSHEAISKMTLIK